MAKLTTSDLTSLTNETSAINTINSNLGLVETAIENTLSRDGTSPNAMGADFDMNGHRILNLPEPLADTEPLRLVDAQPILDAAEDARDAAQLALDQFTDLYLGVKVSDPLVDNDNNALQQGAMYFNSDDEEMRVYGPNSWVPVASFSAYDEVALLVAAAEAARDAAQLAETNAETAETNAEAAETNAELAETNAEAAQALAEAAQALAEVAQAAAEAAQAAAETAETNAELAETNAETAEANAEAAQTAAESARDLALAYSSRYKGTSTSSVAISTGSKSFTTQASKNFDVGVWLLITSDADEANYMHGQVTAYSGTSLTVDVTNIGGSGTLADWTITVAGTRGAIGPAGSVDFTVLTDTAAVSTDSTLFGDASDSDNPKKRTFASLITDLSLLTSSAIGSSVQAWDAQLDSLSAASANGVSLITAADYSAMKVLLDLEIGTDVQAYDADLTTWAGLTPSANAQSLVTAADYAAMRSLLGLVIGTNVQAYLVGNTQVSITIVIDGAGSTITTGIKGDLTIPFNCSITEWTLLADQSGSIVIDIWKDTYANYPPTDADSITSSAPPTISTATKGQSSTLTGWTTTITAGDTLRFNVDSITSCQRVTLSLKCTKT